MNELVELVQTDRRYKLDAYLFVSEALQFGQEALGMGTQYERDLAEDQPDLAEPDDEPAERRGPQRHVSGRELCEAIRQFAWRQYGLMAKCVLNHWGLRSTGDFGEIVYNLIRIRKFRKTPDDRREDFDDVYDFQVGLFEQYRIKTKEEGGRQKDQ